MDVLMELGRRLEGDVWRGVVRAAGVENEWFGAGQVAGAAEVLRREMLERERLERWLAGYEKPAGWSPGRVGVVMAGNLPLVGVADLAAVVAVGHEAVVKPSSKDRVLMEYVAGVLREAGAAVEVVRELRPEGLRGVIATGGDAARRYFEEAFGGLPALLRGSRQSVAVLDGSEPREALKGLAEDMFLYWGLGCRSVVRLFVPRGYDVRELAGRLAEAPPFDPAELPRKFAECGRYARAMAAMGGGAWADGGFFVLRQVPLETAPEAPKIAEVLWSEYDSPEQVAAWLALHEPRLQCAAGAVPASFPRRVPLGRTQRPGWTDYADGVDTVAFLLGL